MPNERGKSMTPPNDNDSDRVQEGVGEVSFEYTYDEYNAQKKLEKRRQGNFFTNLFRISGQSNEGDERGIECAFYTPAEDHRNPGNNGEFSNETSQEKICGGSQPDNTPVVPDSDSVANTIATEYCVGGTNNNGNHFTRLMKIFSSVFPKVEPLPWRTFFWLSFLCSFPVVAYTLLFTQMGYGENIYYSFSQHFGEYSSVIAESLIIFAFLYYIFDIDEWNSEIGNVFRILSTSLMFLGFASLVMLASNKYPYGIISLFALIDPLWLLIVKTMFYRNKETRTYVSWLSGPLFFVSILTAIVFVIWVFLDSGNEWNNVTKVEAAERTGCVPDYHDYPNCMSQEESGGTCFFTYDSTLYFPDGCEQTCLNVYSKCINGIVLWAGPLMMCVSMLFLSFFCTFLRTEGTDEQDIFNFGKIWIFILCAMWASASLSGTVAVGSSLATLTLASLVASAILLSASFSRDQVKYNREEILDRFRKKYGDNLDYVRGLFIVTMSPFVIMYMTLSMINQLVRRVGVNPCSQPSTDSNEPNHTASIFTIRTRKHIEKMKSWDRSRVLTIAVYWGIAYMILQVICAQLTIVFLSWLIDKTADFGLYAVTGIMMGVGAVMFLLPPVPGVPVYLALGIVLTAQGHQTVGWIGAIFYSTGIGLVLKLIASALQQKMIGENLSHFVSIRQFVSVNSNMMRAMKLVLKRHGLSVSKVAILIGGPDWPTSVLCGIMRLSLPQIMLGTTPVVFLIFPTCLTGALLFMASLETESGNPQFPWVGTAAAITASLTAMVQFGSMIVAAYYLERAADKCKDEIEAIEIDQEVKEADDRDELMRNCYKAVTQWRVVPLFMKTMLLSSLAMITASCYMVQFFASMCFIEHSLTDSVQYNLGGNPLNIFLPLGWVAIGLFSAATMFLWMFCTWGKAQARKRAVSETSVPIIA
mmetsp:Transcript_2489/g.5166  ORF Transcript_2489/g.5166 Transcript_2489/m.5166 type:complete len:926 (+) Transcript_2489:227-3004(+)